MRIKHWDRAWDAWLLFTLGSFVSLEYIALHDRGERATLTSHIRRRLGVHPRRRWCTAGRGFIVAATGWTMIHLCAGIWPSEGWFE